MYRYPFDPGKDGLSMTVDGRLFATGLPEPEWLRRRFEHAEALRELSREKAQQRKARQRQASWGARLRARLRHA
jgi:hypothetical protein